MTLSHSGAGPDEGRYDGLLAEAQASVGHAANTLRRVRERYREVHQDRLTGWQAMRAELDELERRPRGGALATHVADEPRQSALRTAVESSGSDLGRHQAELARIDLALTSLETTWLFLERGDASLITDRSAPSTESDLRMRIVEAQEAERARLAQEVHDGPAQSLTNGIFQAEYVERLLDQDPARARIELHDLRDMLRRELSEVRSYIGQLRPQFLDRVGLAGAIGEAAEHFTELTGVPVAVSLDVPGDRLTEAEQTVVLRVVTEALQNVRKHAAARTVTVSTVADGADWALQVQDDGRGFDVGSAAVRGRRNFGLQFMRERAELIGARFEVRSTPDGGTIVRLAIPIGDKETR